MRRSDAVRFAAALLRPRLSGLVTAVVLGALSLGSALALTGVSAWLIARAWQMPPILDLSIAVVAVRALGISRAVFGYAERLAAHNTALRAAGNARSMTYRSLAHGPAGVTRLRSGDVLSRVGTDVDTLADSLVRALVPIGVATVLGIAATVVIALISPVAAVVLALCLITAGVVGPWLSARSARAQEALAREYQADRDAASLLALDHAAELRVAGVLPTIIAEAERRHSDWAHSLDRAAAPSAASGAILTAAMGVSVLGALAAGITLSAQTSPTTLAVLMLLPLAAFEAVSTLPGAAVALVRARIAATRMWELVPSTPGPEAAVTLTAVEHTPVLRADRLAAAFPTTGEVPDPAAPDKVTIILDPGARLAVTGRSGAGKTALLMTLAGLLPPRAGTVSLDGVDLRNLTESQLRSRCVYFAEDAHLFATTVRDNLLVARGDCLDAELVDALRRVGLGEWLERLPEGLGTLLPGGAAAVSAGQRRRLLLARVLLNPAPIVVLDEPTEHLDPEDSDRLLRSMLVGPGTLLAPNRTAIVATHHLGGEFSCPRLAIGDR